MRISHEELFDICGYAVGKQAIDEIKAHYRKYGNFERIKDKIQGQMIADRVELLRLRRVCRSQVQQIERLTQTDMFDMWKKQPVTVAQVQSAVTQAHQQDLKEAQKINERIQSDAT